jgi:hypothetical protein
MIANKNEDKFSLVDELFLNDEIQFKIVNLRCIWRIKSDSIQENSGNRLLR